MAFRNTWIAAYQARIALLGAIAAKSKVLTSAAAATSGDNLWVGSFATTAPSGNYLGGYVNQQGYLDQRGNPTGCVVNLPQSGSYVYWRVFTLNGQAPGWFTVTLKLQVSSTMNIVVATNNATTWTDSARAVATSNTGSSWSTVKLRQYVGSANAGIDLAVGASELAPAMASTPAATAVAICDLVVVRDDSLDSNARNILSGVGGVVAGTVNWDTSGTVNSGSGVAMTSKGIYARNAANVTTFSLDATTGDATFSGTLTAGIVKTSSIEVGAVTTNTPVLNAASAATFSGVSSFSFDASVSNGTTISTPNTFWTGSLSLELSFSGSTVTHVVVASAFLRNNAQLGFGVAGQGTFAYGAKSAITVHSNTAATTLPVYCRLADIGTADFRQNISVFFFNGSSPVVATGGYYFRCPTVIQQALV